MPFNYDDIGVEKRSFTLLPVADYPAVIRSATPGLTGKGDDKVTVTYEIIDGEYKGKTIKNHTVTFFKDRKTKGAGMALSFLKAIGEPWEGQFEVDEKRWVGKYCLVHIKHEDDKQDPKKKWAKVAWVNEFKAPEHDPFKKEEESVPF
jgi:hypothetical protein